MPLPLPTDARFVGGNAPAESRLFLDDCPYPRGVVAEIIEVGASRLQLEDHGPVEPRFPGGSSAQELRLAPGRAKACSTARDRQSPAGVVLELVDPVARGKGNMLRADQRVREAEDVHARGPGQIWRIIAASLTRQSAGGGSSWATNCRTE